MKAAIVPAVVFLMGVISVAQQRSITSVQTPDDEVRLRATVQAVVPITHFSGEVTPVDVDPKFALTVRVESAVPPVPNFRSGAVVTFAIHSPSLLFAGDSAQGKTYDFVLLRRVENAKVRFRGLRVR